MRNRDDDSVRATGVVGRTVAWLAKHSGLLLAALLFAVLIEWIGMSTVWTHEGANHSREMLLKEMRALNLEVVQQAPGGHAVVQGAANFSEWFYHLFAKRLRVEGALETVERVDALHSFTALLGIPPPHHYSLSALNVIQMFGLKLVVVTLALPVYAMFFLWGMGEGLTVRALRRYSAAHETAYVFHHAKKFVWPTVALPVLFYLAWPVHVPPVWVFGPCALVYGAAWVVMVAKFKRYL